MAKQSKLDRLARLADRRCPVHGGWMGQIDHWYDEHTDRPYTIAGCDRKTCGIKAKHFSFEEPLELLPEWQFLLEQSEEGTAKIIPLKPPAHKNNADKNAPENHQ